MAGRHKILGNEKCPDPDCPGSGKLGRIRRKPARNRPDSRYVDRYYFRHNDSEIKEHYVDNFVRPKEFEKNPGLKISEEYLKIGHSIEKISKRIMSFPLTLEERKSLNIRLEWFKHNFLVPLDMIADITTGRLKVPPENRAEIRKALWELATYSLYSEANPFVRGYDFIYKKYDQPRRLERNRLRNAKISKGNGRSSNEYTGIEPAESIKTKIK